MGGEAERAAGGEGEGAGGGTAGVEGEDAAEDLDGAGVGEGEVEGEGPGEGGFAQGGAGLVVEGPRAGDVEDAVVLKIPEAAGEVGEGAAGAVEDEVAGGRIVDGAGVGERAGGESGVAGIRDGQGAAGEESGGAGAAHRPTCPRASRARQIQIARAVDRAVGQAQIIDRERGIQRDRATVADGRAFRRGVGHVVGIPICPGTPVAGADIPSDNLR